MARPSMTVPVTNGRNNWTIKLQIDEVGSGFSCTPISSDGDPLLPFQSRGPRASSGLSSQVRPTTAPGPFSVSIEQIFEDDPLFFAGTDNISDSVGPSVSKTGDLGRLSARSLDRKNRTKDVDESIDSLFTPSKSNLKKKRSSKKNKAGAGSRSAARKQSPNTKSKMSPQPVRTTKSKLGSGKRKSPQKAQRRYEDSDGNLSGRNGWTESDPRSRVSSFQSSKGSQPNSRAVSLGGDTEFQTLSNTSASSYAQPLTFSMEKASANFAESHTALSSNIRELEENLRRITQEYNQLKREFEEQKVCMASVCAERDKNGRAVAELSQIISSNENAQHNLLSVIQDMKGKMESLEMRGLLAPINSAPYAQDLATQAGASGSGSKCPANLGNSRKGTDVSVPPPDPSTKSAAAQPRKTISDQKLQRALSKTFSKQKLQKAQSKTFINPKLQKTAAQPSKMFGNQKVQKSAAQPSKTMSKQKLQKAQSKTFINQKIQKIPSNPKFKRTASNSKMKKTTSKPKVKLNLNRK